MSGVTEPMKQYDCCSVILAVRSYHKRGWEPRLQGLQCHRHSCVLATDVRHMLALVTIAALVTNMIPRVCNTHQLRAWDIG